MLSIAVDIGGTFTDVVGADSDTGVYHAVKVPTTPRHLVDGIREATLRVLAAHDADPGQVSRFIHGTTIGTNAVLERKGARTAVISTAGFEDVLEIGRLKRTHMYDLFMDPETPVFLSPKRLRRGVRERMAADGTVVEPLDEEHARLAIQELHTEHNVDAFAVCLLFSFRNPVHEERLRDIIHELDPALSVSISSEVDPMFREYERTVVTTVDAYIRPVIAAYVSSLAAELQAIDIEAPLQIMQSRGGITSADLVTRRPVSVLLSGPAAGVIGGRFAGARSGISNLISIDVGGTSADISLIESGKPLISTEGKIDIYPLRIPMVDVNTIGAGGGSIAWIDAGGSFHVGPQSAGSDPGPVCYGRGGAQPTVTDASVVLGYLNADYFAGGAMRLDVDAAHDALSTFGKRIGLSATEAAAGIHRIINSKMADEIRLVSIRRGYDPRDFALVLLGGAGSVHGGRLAEELGIPTMIVPPVPGVLSALGLLVANVEHDQAETVALRADRTPVTALNEAYARLESRVAERMAADHVPPGAAVTTRFSDMRYVGQSYTLEIPVPTTLDGPALETVVHAFHDAHARIYGHANPGAPVELVNVRVVQTWALPHEGLRAAASPAGAQSSPSVRRAYFAELGGHVDTPVYRRHMLRTDEVLDGPAIIEQADTTVILYPGHRAVLEESGNLRITAKSPAIVDTFATVSQA